VLNPTQKALTIIVITFDYTHEYSWKQTECQGSMIAVYGDIIIQLFPLYYCRNRKLIINSNYYYVKTQNLYKKKLQNISIMHINIKT